MGYFELNMFCQACRSSSLQEEKVPPTPFVSGLKMEDQMIVTHCLHHVYRGIPTPVASSGDQNDESNNIWDRLTMLSMLGTQNYCVPTFTMEC